jgi:hypothetical protein
MLFMEDEIISGAMFPETYEYLHVAFPVYNDAQSDLTVCTLHEAQRTRRYACPVPYVLLL